MATLYNMRGWRCFLVVTLILHSLSWIVASHCVFDEVKPRIVVETNVSYSLMDNIYKNNAVRCKRDVSDSPVAEDLFQPIRIHAYFSSTIETNINAVQRMRLTTVIDRIVSTASHIFSGKFLYSLHIVNSYC